MCLVTCHECIIQLQEKQELFCFCQKLILSGCEPEFPKFSILSICSISSGNNEKSKTSEFSFIRDGVTDAADTSEYIFVQLFFRISVQSAVNLDDLIPVRFPADSMLLPVSYSLYNIL